MSTAWRPSLKILYLPHQYSQQRQHEKKRWIYPVLLAMQAEHYRRLGHEVIWEGPFDKVDRVITEPEDINFMNLPAPDRIFTKAFSKKYQENGNFKYRPGTYIQVANGCWHGKCTFCVERNNTWQVRELWHVYQEIVKIKKQGFREVFDDSGTFPVGDWLDRFLCLPNPGLVMGCNMRMVDAPWERMKEWGFRMVLFGLESANQKTLDRIHKGVKCEDIKHIIAASKAGLDPHIAVMFGFPWESDEDAGKTLILVKYLLENGYAKTAQASFYKPNGTDGNVEHKRFVNRIYGTVATSPKFWINKFRYIKSKEDLGYFFRQIREGLFHG